MRKVIMVEENQIVLPFVSNLCSLVKYKGQHEKPEFIKPLEQELEKKF
jgi:hypothetical protein